nr:MAG TPA: hypothetical protein [Caudoviricetes sp.]
MQLTIVRLLAKKKRIEMYNAQLRALLLLAGRFFI